VLMSIGSVINMATGINNPIISTSSRYAWSLVFLIFLLVGSVILNILFIPRYGIEGAAIATGLSSTLYNLMKFIYIWKKFDMQPYDLSSLKTLFVIGIALGAGLLIPS